jgi:hypothetical protein
MSLPWQTCSCDFLLLTVMHPCQSASWGGGAPDTFAHNQSGIAYQGKSRRPQSAKLAHLNTQCLVGAHPPAWPHAGEPADGQQQGASAPAPPTSWPPCTTPTRSQPCNRAHLQLQTNSGTPTQPESAHLEQVQQLIVLCHDIIWSRQASIVRLSKATLLHFGQSSKVHCPKCHLSNSTYPHCQQTSAAAIILVTKPLTGSSHSSRDPHRRPSPKDLYMLLGGTKPCTAVPLRPMLQQQRQRCRHSACTHAPMPSMLRHTAPTSALSRPASIWQHQMHRLHPVHYLSACTTPRRVPALAYHSPRHILQHQTHTTRQRFTKQALALAVLKDCARPLRCRRCCCCCCP